LQTCHPRRTPPQTIFGILQGIEAIEYSQAQRPERRRLAALLEMSGGELRRNRKIR
jgi:hypothetical protein